MEKITREKVSPAKAEKWLNLNKNNRTMRNGIAEKYAEDMRQGRWTECVAPIVFYEDGDVADGQHRLWAIVDSGATFEFTIHRGLPRDAGLNIDTGAPRTLVDNARISGTDPDLSHILIAVARAIDGAPVKRGRKTKADALLSNAEKIAAIDKHREAANWAIAHGPKGKRLRNAIVLAAVARAWYHEADKTRLMEFGAVVTSGMPTNGVLDSGAIAIRNYMLTTPNVHYNSKDEFRDFFFKVQNGIWYFMRKKAISVIKTIGEERYPLHETKGGKLKTKAILSKADDE